MGFYSREQIERASKINLVEYLHSTGERLQQSGREYKWIYFNQGKEHDSISIREHKWYDHKNGVGGDAIEFLKTYIGFDFNEAINELIQEEPEIENAREFRKNNGKSKVEKSKQKIEQSIPQPVKPFVLPEKGATMKNLFAYLIKTRFIDREILTFFVKQKLLYQEKSYGNIVFLGTDENGVVKSAQERSSNSRKKFQATIRGSDTRYGFHWRGGGESLYVFEAPIDLLSYLTIDPKDWQENSYLSLDGLSPKAMFYFLENNPNIKEVKLCLDHDEAGIETGEKFKYLLQEKGYKVKKQYPYLKDWNEILISDFGGEAKPAESHPKIESYSKLLKQLKKLNQSDGENYIKWRNQNYGKMGEKFILKALEKEMELFQNSVEYGKITKVTSEGIYSALVRMADISLFFYGKNSNAMYNEVLKQMELGYKVHEDRGKFKNYCSNVEMYFESLKKEEPYTFKNLANACLKTKVYLDTKYEKDLKLAENLLQSFSLRNGAIEKQSNELEESHELEQSHELEEHHELEKSHELEEYHELEESHELEEHHELEESQENEEAEHMELSM